MVLATEGLHFEDTSKIAFDLVAPIQDEYPPVSHNFIGKVATLFEQRFDQDFESELHDPKIYQSEDGLNIPVTYRLFNEEFLNNGNPVVVYNFSLFVPGHRGAELPTLYKITKLAKERGSSVIAITTDGYDQPLTKVQIESLKDFNAMANRKLKLLESVCCDDQELIITGSSLGGMMSYAMASLNSQDPNPKLNISKIISICSAGHNTYSPKDLLHVFRQFSTGELLPAAHYLADGHDLPNLWNRFLDIIDTFPSTPQQVVASAMIAYAILKSPLLGVETLISPDTVVIDEVYSRDPVSKPFLRPGNWEKAKEHPPKKHSVKIEDGNHLSLLTKGLGTTLKHLF